MGLDETLFLDPVFAAEYKCAICDDIAESPISFPCKNGHVYCAECAQNQNNCPQCRGSRGNSALQPIVGQVRRIYNLLNLKCPQKCKWQGALSDLENHYTKCSNTPVSCVNKGCSRIFLRTAINAHRIESCDYRTVTCEHCKGKFLAKDLGEHHTQCLSFPLQCEYGKARCPQITRAQKGRHEEVCPFLQISCEWKEFGCPYRCERQLLSAHHGDPAAVASHLRLVRVAYQHDIALLSLELAELKMEVESSSSSSSSSASSSAKLQLQQTDVFVDFSRFVLGQKVSGEPFEFCGVQWRVLLYPKGTNLVPNHLCLFLCAINPPADLSLRVKFSVVLVARSNPKLSQHWTSTGEFTHKAPSLGWTEFIELSKLPEKEAGFIKNDCLIVKTTVELA